MKKIIWMMTFLALALVAALGYFPYRLANNFWGSMFWIYGFLSVISFAGIHIALTGLEQKILARLQQRTEDEQQFCRLEGLDLHKIAYEESAARNRWLITWWLVAVIITGILLGIVMGIVTLQPYFLEENLNLTQRGFISSLLGTTLLLGGSFYLLFYFLRDLVTVPDDEIAFLTGQGTDHIIGSDLFGKEAIDYVSGVKYVFLFRLLFGIRKFPWIDRRFKNLPIEHDAAEEKLETKDKSYVKLSEITYIYQLNSSYAKLLLFLAGDAVQEFVEELLRELFWKVTKKLVKGRTYQELTFGESSEQVKELSEAIKEEIKNQQEKDPLFKIFTLKTLGIGGIVQPDEAEKSFQEIVQADATGEAIARFRKKLKDSGLTDHAIELLVFQRFGAAYEEKKINLGGAENEGNKLIATAYGLLSKGQ
jgi:hypothetical protein